MNEVNLEKLHNLCKGTMVEHLGIVFLEISQNSVSASMPVDSRTKQPMGLLHGGASLALAETIASVAALLNINQETHYCVGLDINANHIKSVSQGGVTGRASPIHIGKQTQVWEVKIYDDNENLICICRATLAVLKHQ
jgi:1,4-dihydroxy-2-naphthoyl-CoA hydrolase